MDLMTFAVLKKKIQELEKSLVDKFEFKFKLVDSLPTIGEPNMIYLIKIQSEEADNYYEEYIYLDGKWEKLGATQMDLTNVATKEELEELAAKQFSGSWNDLTNKPFGYNIPVPDTYGQQLDLSYTSEEIDGKTYRCYPSITTGIYTLVTSAGDVTLSIYRTYDEDNGTYHTTVIGGQSNFGFDAELYETCFLNDDTSEFARTTLYLYSILKAETWHYESAKIPNSLLPDDIPNKMDVDRSISQALDNYTPNWDSIEDKPFYDSLVYGEPEIVRDGTIDLQPDQYSHYIIDYYDSDKNNKYSLIFSADTFTCQYDGNFSDGFTKVNHVNGEAWPNWLYLYRIPDSNSSYTYDLPAGICNLQIIKTPGRIETTPLDEKYIPDTIARKSDLENISTEVSWNDLTDKPFYDLPGTTVTAPVVNGEFTFDLPGVTMEQECIVTYSGNATYDSFEANLLDLASSTFFTVSKIPTSALVNIEVTSTGIHCTGRLVNHINEIITDADGTITAVVSSCLATLDDKYISENIARTSDVETTTAEMKERLAYLEKFVEAMLAKDPHIAMIPIDQAWFDENGESLPSGWYYLTDDIAYEPHFFLKNGSDVTICLNNHTLDFKHANGIEISNSSTLRIDECVGNGNVNVTRISLGPANNTTVYDDRSSLYLSGGNLNTTNTGYPIILQAVGVELHIDGGKLNGSPGRYAVVIPNEEDHVEYPPAAVVITGGVIETSGNGSCVLLFNNAGCIRMEGSPVLNSSSNVSEIVLYDGALIDITGILNPPEGETYVVDLNGVSPTTDNPVQITRGFGRSGNTTNPFVAYNSAYYTFISGSGDEAEVFIGLVE